MSDASWVLKGVDAETRQRAVEEAERRGVSVADYLTDVLLQGALTAQLQLQTGEPDAGSAAEADGRDLRAFAQPIVPQENFAVRHRLEALERRVGLAVGGLDSAIHSLDSSVFGLAARVDEAEMLGADTANTLNLALNDLSAGLAALRKRLADNEDGVGALGEALEGARAEIGERFAAAEQRLETVEDAARAANTSAAQLAVAHEALKYAVADDFSAFARESAARLSTGLEEVCAAADAAAQQADAAAAHLVEELGSLRTQIEDRLAENAAETRARMHAAFADAAERLGSLTERVIEHERTSARATEQIRAQISDVEDGAQTALEVTAEALRQADAAVAADLARFTEDARTAFEAARTQLSGEISEVRERQLGDLARLKLVDSAVANVIGDVTVLRETFEEVSSQHEAALRHALRQTQGDWDARFDAITARLAGGENELTTARRAMEAQVERVEACAFAALDKLTQDITALDTSLDAKLAQSAAATEALIEQVRARLDGEVGDIRDQHVGALARLRLIDKALAAQDIIAAVEAGAAPVAERLTRLEAISDPAHAETAFARFREQAAAQTDAYRRQADAELAQLRERVEILAARVAEQLADQDLTQRIDDLRARLSAHETQLGETTDRVHGVARMLGRVTAQNADASTQSEERLHKLELALADLRLETLSAPAETQNAAPALQAIEQRMAELEQRQADAFEQLRDDVAHFIGVNDRRLAALENTEPADGYDLASEFEALRRRMEERVLGVEQRSVRALEQVAETVAVIEQRFTGRDERSAKIA